MYVEVEVTSKCNLMCPGCARTIVPKQFLGHHTTVETVKKIAPLFPYVRLVSFVGPFGDPFLNPNFWDLHRVAKDAGARTCFFTNAMLMSEDHIQKVFTEKTDMVFISIDSIEPELYENIKRGTDYDIVMNAIRRLVSLKKERRSMLPVIAINYVIQKKNVEELPRVMEFAAKEGIERVYFTGLLVHNKESVENSILKIDRSVLQGIFEQIRRQAKALRLEARLPEIHLPTKYMTCCAPWQVMVFYNNGDVSACTHFRFPKPCFFYVKDGKFCEGVVDCPSLLMGNVNEENVLDIWNNRKYRELRKGLKNGCAELPCKACYYPYGWH
ncbi:MAG: radical SAM protein [Deltaproteobacteria bacterium]|nr:radical SAM protein [Deltaproteobacteria bacterium]